MANNLIQIKRTSVSGRAANTTTLQNPGELALNMTDGILYSTNGSVVFEIGANTTAQRITNSLTLDNDKQLRFNTVNSSSYAYFVQQNDDNFVFYTTNASYSPRAIFSIYANSNSSALQFGSPVLFNGPNVNINSSTALYANGSPGAAGQVLTSNGSAVYWTAVSGSGSTNVNAQYVWSNLHTFQANTSFTGNNISVVSNTGSVMFAGSSDTNWRIGRSTGATTKFYYTNNTLDIIAAASNLEGFVIGQPGGNTYLETGYAGTFTKNPIYVGNATVNVSINSTSFSGTAANASLLNNKAEADLNVNNALTANSASYLGSKQEAGLNVNSALTSNNSTYAFGKTEGNLNVNSALTSNNSSYLGGVAAASYQLNSTLAANVATLAANSASYTTSIIGGLAGSIPYQNAPGVTTFVTIGTNNYVMTSNGSVPQWTNPNSMTIGTANNTTYVNGKTEGNLNVNSALTANLATYIKANTGLVSNATGVYVNSAYIATLSANDTTYVNGKTENNLNVNSALTSNNSTYAFGKTEVNLNVNSALTSNNSTYAFGKNQIDLNVNNALTANLASYVVANSGIVSNATGVYVNSAYIATLSANNTTYVNGKTEGNLNVNSALTSNNTTYVNGKTEGNLNVNNALTANNSSYLNGKVESALNVNSAVTSNTANNTTYVNGKAESALNVNNALTANLASYVVANSGIVSNATGVFVNTTYIATLTANNTTYVNGKTEGNLNVNNALTANNSSYLNSKTESALNVNSSLTSNNSTYAFGKTESALNVNNALTANSSTYLGSKQEAGLNVNSALTSNNSTYAFGKTEGNLNVNTALTANNADYLDGQDGTYYAANSQLANYALLAGANFTGTVSFGNSTSNAVVNNSVLKLAANQSIDFNTSTYKPAFQAGRMYWDDEEKTVVIYGGSPSTEFEISVGQREWFRGRNGTSNTIYKGQPVYCTGVHIAGNTVHGHHLSIALADASDEVKKDVIGLAGEDIAAGAHGYVVTRGYIETVNTVSLTSGGRVHLGYSAPGTLVSSAPEYPNWPMDVGICLTANDTYGTLYVDIVDHSAERFRVAQDLVVGQDLTVLGGLYVTGNVTTTSAVNLSVESNFIYVGSGDTISNTTFTGTGLNDMLYHGVYEGSGSTTYYVKIDGTGATDTFAWSKDNFSTTIASGVAITGGDQALDNGITIKFNAITGHTLNDKWTGSAAPVNVDVGVVGNYNDGSYAHTGIFRDASDGYWKVFDNYIPEPDANVNIDTSNTSFHIANFWANTLHVGNTTTYATINTTSFTGTSNNSTYAYGKVEGALNVNSAISSNTANNTTYVNGKTEGNLNVNNAVTSNTANNSTYAYGKTEINLNVNNAVTSNTANNSTYAFGKTEANLNVNNAVTSNTANNSTYAYGKTEGNLNVNSAVTSNTANNTTYVNGKTEGNLNVNSAVTSNTANNSSYLGGTAAASYVQNTDSRTLSGNIYFTGSNVYYSAGLFIGANVVANTSTIVVGNSTVNTTISAGQVTVNGQVLATNNYLTTNYTTNSTIYSTFAQNTTVYSTFAQNTTVYSTFAQNTSVYSTFAQNTSVYSTFAQNTSVYSTFAQNTSVYSTFAQNTAVYANFAQLAANNTLSGNQYFQGTNNYFTAGLFVGANVSVNTTAIKYGPTTRDSFSNTTTGTTSQIIDSWAVATYRSAKYTLSVKDNNANAFMLSEMLVLFDSVNPQTTEYALIISNTSLGTFSANSNTTHVRLTFTPTSTNTTVKADRLLITT